MSENKTIYYIRIISTPEEEPIVLNQEGYDSLLTVCEMCCSNEKESKPSEPYVMISSSTNMFYFGSKNISYEEALYLTELALHINIRRLKISIRNKLF